MASKKKVRNPRNAVVIHMISRSWGAGSHGDKRKQESRNKCRGKVREDD